MGELVSMWPTAGGQYHWVYMLASILEDDMDNGSNGHGRVEGGDNKRKKWAPFLSYITGWQSVIAWQALTASGSYLTATAIQGLVVNTQSDYHFERWHGTLMVFALLLICFLFNTFCCRLFPHVETAVLFLHITLFIVVLVVIAVMAPVKSANSDVWALWLNQGGYESKGLSFFVGLITPVFAFSGADGAVHMSEEIRGSSRVVPWALSSKLSCFFLLVLEFVICVEK